MRGVGTGAVEGKEIGADERRTSRSIKGSTRGHHRPKRTLFFISSLVQLAHRSSLAKVCDFSLAVPQFHTKSKSAG